MGSVPRGWSSAPAPKTLLPFVTGCLLLCTLIQIEFKPLASVSHCNAIIFLQHKIRDLLRPRVADTKEERFCQFQWKWILIFSWKKKKRKTWRYYISLSEKEKTQKTLCHYDIVKTWGFKSRHKAQQLHSPSPFTGLFHYPGYSSCFFLGCFWIW